MTTSAHHAAPVRTIGFIGSGHIGSTLARLAVAAGYDVVMSNSRGPETLSGLVAGLGPNARAAGVVEAGRSGDVVVVTVPLYAVHAIPPEAVDGKVVLDTCNYYPGRDGEIQPLEEETLTTSELVQQHLAGATVVKGCNNIAFGALADLARPSGSSDRSALPIAGDDAQAKRAVAHLLDTLGFDTLDAGDLAEGWRFQRDTPAYVTPYAGPGGVTDPQPADGGTIGRLLGEARRYRDM